MGSAKREATIQPPTWPEDPRTAAANLPMVMFLVTDARMFCRVFEDGTAGTRRDTPHWRRGNATMIVR